MTTRKKKGATNRTKNSTAVSAANVEQSARNEQVAKSKIKAMDSPCRINFHSRRYRLTDADGCSGKAALDGLVHAGLFPDDSAQYVEKVSHTQEKIKKPALEETIIEIYNGGRHEK